MLGNLNQEIDKVKQNITKSLTNVKTESLTALDVTTKKLKEGIALKTNDDVGVAGVINDYKETIVTKLDGVIGKLTTGALNAKNTIEVLKLQAGTVDFDSKDLLAAVGADLGLALRGSSGVIQKLTEGITEEFERLNGLGLSEVLLKDGSTFRLNENWRDAVGLDTLKNVMKYTNLDEYLDTNIVSAVRNTVFKSAVAYGMVDSFLPLLESYPKGFEDFKRDILIETSELALKAGDILSASKLVGFLEDGVKQSLINKAPTVIEDLLSNFKYDKSSGIKDNQTLLPLFENVLEGVGGKEWYMKDTSFGSALNLSLVQDISEDSKSVLMGAKSPYSLLAASGMFKESDGMNLLGETFPTAPKYDV